jgi:hypothetical protein
MNSILFSQLNLSIQSMVQTVITLLILGGVCWLLLYLIGYLAPPEPINKICRAVVVVFAVLILIGMLLSFAGHPVVNWR